MRVISRVFWALVFFTLFAFALNNQQPATVRFFFGLDWQGPMVFVVLVAFGAGCALGIVAMAPHWWRQRREARRLADPTSPPAAQTLPARSTDFGAEHPPREGL